jgi:hypothetical protein
MLNAKVLDYTKKFGKEVLNVLQTPVFEIKIGEPKPQEPTQEVNDKADELAAMVELLQRKFNGL